MKKYFLIIYITISACMLYSHQLRGIEIDKFPFLLDYSEIYEEHSDVYTDPGDPIVIEIKYVVLLENNLMEIRYKEPVFSTTMYCIDRHRELLKVLRKFIKWAKKVDSESNTRVSSIAFKSGGRFEEKDEMHYFHGFASLYFVSKKDNNGDIKPQLELRFAFMNNDEGTSFMIPSYIFTPELANTFIEKFNMREIRQSSRQLKKMISN